MTWLSDVTDLHKVLVKYKNSRVRTKASFKVAPYVHHDFYHVRFYSLCEDIWQSSVCIDITCIYVYIRIYKYSIMFLKQLPRYHLFWGDVHNMSPTSKKSLVTTTNLPKSFTKLRFMYPSDRFVSFLAAKNTHQWMVITALPCMLGFMLLTWPTATWKLKASHPWFDPTSWIQNNMRLTWNGHKT